MIGSIYGDNWNRLAVPLLEQSANAIVQYHNPSEQNFDKGREHPVGTHTATCIECERFVRILMLLQGMEYQRSF